MMQLTRIRSFMFIIVAVFAALCFGNVCAAKEQILMEIQQDTKVYEDEDTDSKIVGLLRRGTPVICTEGEQEGWYCVSYQEIQGFVQLEILDEYGDSEELSKEFQDLEEDDDARLQNLYEEEKQNHSDRVWGSIIVILLVLILVMGIYTVHKNKAAGTKDSDG